MASPAIQPWCPKDLTLDSPTLRQDYLRWFGKVQEVDVLKELKEDTWVRIQTQQGRLIRRVRNFSFRTPPPLN